MVGRGLERPFSQVIFKMDLLDLLRNYGVCGVCVCVGSPLQN